MSGSKKINQFIVVAISIIVLGIIACISYLLMLQQTIIKDGDVLAGIVRIVDEKYVYTAFETMGRTTKIAEIDNWDIYEVSEDPEHIFLKMKSFTREHYIIFPIIKRKRTNGSILLLVMKIVRLAPIIRFMV